MCLSTSFISCTSEQCCKLTEEEGTEEETEARVRVAQNVPVSPCHLFRKYTQRGCGVPGAVLGVADQDPRPCPWSFPVCARVNYNGVTGLFPVPTRGQDLGGGTADASTAQGGSGSTSPRARWAGWEQKPDTGQEGTQLQETGYANA